MKKYSVSRVRERLSDALDQAERGESVLIERRGITYRLSVEKSPRPRASARARIEIVDKAVERGAWTWEWQNGEMQFRARRR